VRGSSTILAITFVLAAGSACGKSPVPAPDAGARAPVPAPSSALARELGADDAGRGEYRLYDDGPWCGFAPRVDRDKALDKTPDSPPPESAWLGFFETKTPPRDGPRLYERAAISLSLTGPQRAFTRQPLPLVLSLMNGTAQPLHYGMPVDGSFEHWRGPFFDLYARDEGSGRTYRWTFGKGVGRCGNMNDRTSEDLVLLPPGARKTNPFGPHSRTTLAPVFMNPGRYTLWVVYSSSCVGAEIGSGGGYDGGPPTDLFDGTIASNGLTLEITKEP
jgi:hypothetical protein